MGGAGSVPAGALLTEANSIPLSSLTGPGPRGRSIFGPPNNSGRRRVSRT